jgi:hypothetical protein
MDAGRDAHAAALDRLEAEDPAAAQALRACAFLAPEPVPAEWFTNAASQLAEPLRGVAADPVTWRLSLARISGQALGRIDAQGLLPHPLTQATKACRHPGPDGRGCYPTCSPLTPTPAPRRSATSPAMRSGT